MSQTTLILGNDFGMDVVVTLSSITLIGKFMIWNISKFEFSLWVKCQMADFLRYIPRWHILLRGCIFLEFQCGRDLKKPYVDLG